MSGSIEGRTAILECINGSGMYGRSVLGIGRILQFTGGKTNVTLAELEILKKSRKYGREFAVLGQLKNPARARNVEVIQGTPTGPVIVVQAPGARSPMAPVASEDSAAANPTAQNAPIL